MFELRKKEKNVYEYVVKLTKKEWDEFVEKAYEQNKDKYSVQGFRKGKVPKKVIEQNYGESIFFDDAFDIALNKSYVEILTENKEIQPISQPDIKVEKFDENGVEVAVKIQSAPEVKLGAYTGLTIEKAKAELGKDKVDAELKQMQERTARFVAVERTAKLGDFVTIDFVGRVDGKEFEGGKAEDYRLELGSHSFIDTFEDQIVGMTIGEKKTIKVTFPENYTVELKNKPAEFDVTLTKVEEKELPKLDDEFASNVSEFETLAELTADIKKHLQESLDAELEKETENKIVEEIVKNCEIDIPEVMVNEQLDFIVQDFETRLAYQGAKMEDYFNYTNSNIETFRKEREEQAKIGVKTRLVFEEIIKKENLNITDAEIDAKLQEIASKYKKSAEDYKKSMGENELNHFKNVIIMEKLITFLKKNNNLV